MHLLINIDIIIIIIFCCCFNVCMIYQWNSLDVLRLIELCHSYPAFLLAFSILIELKKKKKKKSIQKAINTYYT